METTKKFMREMGHKIDLSLNGDKKGSNRSLGFVLLVFLLKSPGTANYITNGQREDVIQAMFETAYRLKNDEDTKY